MSVTAFNAQAVREREFPITESWCYLDHASRGPLPASHVAAVTAFANDLMCAGEPFAYQTADKMDELRGLAGGLMNAEASDIALLTSTGRGFGVVASGLDWQEGDEIVTYAKEFPGVVIPWLQLEDRGVRVRFVEDRDGRYEVDDVAALITDRTRVVALSLVNFVSGFRAPIEAIADLCKPRGIWLVVDVAQALGAIPVDAQALRADVLTAQVYKHVLGGFGISVCYCSPEIREVLRVASAGWAGRPKEFIGSPDYTIPLSPDARRFEASHPGSLEVRGLLASLTLLTESDPALYQGHIADLSRELTEGLQARGWVVANSDRPAERSSIVSAVKPTGTADSLDEDMRKAHVACSVRSGRLRLAPHLYNTSQDTEYFFECLDRSV
jgi:cysteine desulfurase/selenocysteine lyase